jgi:hypothetical protein
MVTMSGMFPLDPQTLATIIASKKSDTEYGDPIPIPEGARKEYARFVRVLAEWEQAQRMYKLWDARMDAVKIELAHALEREYPKAINGKVKWDPKDGTFQLEKDDEDVKEPPAWVADMMKVINAEDEQEGDA